MQKGFTRKPQPDEPATRVKNYITPSGLERLKDEHRFLLTRERPAVTEVVAWAASNGDRSENADYQYGKRRLRTANPNLIPPVNLLMQRESRRQSCFKIDLFSGDGVLEVQKLGVQEISSIARETGEIFKRLAG